MAERGSARAPAGERERDSRQTQGGEEENRGEREKGKREEENRGEDFTFGVTYIYVGGNEKLRARMKKVDSRVRAAGNLVGFVA